MEKERIVYDKKEIYEDYFCYKVPKCISAYVHLDGFKSEMIALYGIITDFYNSDYGYAFPTIDRVALLYGKSNKTTSQHLKILEKYGLLDIIKTDKGNNIYVPFLPLMEDELFKEYPQAKAHYEQVVREKEQEKERSIQNLLKHRGYKYNVGNLGSE